MNLKNYEWFCNPRGLHNSGPFRPLDVQRYLRPRMGWAKLVAGSDEYVDEAAILLENNCMPIIRIHRVDMGAMAVPDDWYATYRAYYDVGCRWFELYNEPNTFEAWPKNPDGEPVIGVSWENIEGCIRPLMDNWLDWAERMIGMGAYPAFPALAASSEREMATVYWLDALLNYLGQTHRERFMRITGSGLWCASHPYLLNHFYQEPPGGPPHVARPYYQQSADEESGWHFEYPYDPVLQHHDPRRTVFGATKAAPYGDTDGLIAAGEAFQQLLKHRFNAGPVPVVGTEGGIAPIPKPGDRIVQPDKLYPAYSAESHAEATLAMWRWIVDSGPDWLFGVALTDEAEYYDVQGEVPAVQRMAEAPIVLKDVADIDTGGAKPAELPEPEAEPAVIVEGRAETISVSEPVAASTGDVAEIVEAAVDEEVEEQMPSVGWDVEDQAIEPESIPPVIAEEEAEGETAAEEAASPPVEVDILELLTPPGTATAEKVDIHEEAGEEPAVEAPVETVPPEEEIEHVPADEALGEPVPTWIEELENGEPEAASGRPAWIEGLDLAAVETSAPPSVIEPEPAEVSEAETEPELVEEPESPEEPEPEKVEEPGEELPEWVEEFDRGIVEAVIAISTESQVSQVEEEMPLPEPSEETLEEEAVEVPSAELPAEEVKEEDFEVEVLEVPDWLDESEVFTGEGIEVEEQELPEAQPEPEEEPEEQQTEYIPSFARADEVETPDEFEEEGEEEPAEPDIQLAPNLTAPEDDRLPAWQVEPELEALEEEPVEEEVKEEAPAEPPAPVEEISQYWLLIAPGFNQEWFFDAGVRYWQKFRPVVLPNWEMAGQLAAGQTVAVTVLANSDTVDQVEAHLKEIDGIAQIDIVAVDTLEDLRAELEWRANTDKQMG
jgi:hypothetical protein